MRIEKRGFGLTNTAEKPKIRLQQFPDSKTDREYSFSECERCSREGGFLTFRHKMTFSARMTVPINSR
jgi:hypothetical protein